MQGGPKNFTEIFQKEKGNLEIYQHKHQHALENAENKFIAMFTS